MSVVLGPDFYERDTEVVAKDLLGHQLCRQFDSGELLTLEINEVEAYLGTVDSACHSFNNRRTERTKVMYGSPGTIYMYLIYGMYWMLNIVTESVGTPTAVLIRGAGKYDGPGKLTRALDLDKSFNNKLLGPDVGLWIEQSSNSRKHRIVALPRIGINYATEPWKSAPLRFMLE